MPNVDFTSQAVFEEAVIARENGVLTLPDPFVLESGEALRGAKLAWECVGPANAPLIVVLGGISAHRRCDAVVAGAVRGGTGARYGALSSARRGLAGRL